MFQRLPGLTLAFLVNMKLLLLAGFGFSGWFAASVLADDLTSDDVIGWCSWLARSWVACNWHSWLADLAWLSFHSDVPGCFFLRSRLVFQVFLAGLPQVFLAGLTQNLRLVRRLYDDRVGLGRKFGFVVVSLLLFRQVLPPLPVLQTAWTRMIYENESTFWQRESMWHVLKRKR